MVKDICLSVSLLLILTMLDMKSLPGRFIYLEDPKVYENKPFNSDTVQLSPNQWSKTKLFI